MPPLPLAARRRLAVALAATVTVDLSTKTLAANVLEDRSIEIGGGLSLRLAHNTGAAFGLGNTLPTLVVVAFTLGITVLIAALGWRGHLGPPILAGIVAGGALSNVLDRLVGGSVVDMIYLPWWPTFNVADIAITTGTAALVVHSLFFDRREQTAQGSN